MANDLLLQEAIQNLIDNALKYAGPRNTEINVRVTSLDGEAVVCVSDKGIGLKSADSGLAFSRFGQVQPGEGSGLGLDIVDEIARLHGGFARIESSNLGAKVSITLSAILK